MPNVTLLFAGLHGLLLLALLVPIVRLRRGRKVGLGDGGDIELLRRIRVHGNFVETVPFVLLLLALDEMAGAGRWAIVVLGSTLLAARLLHAYGLSRSEGYSIGRFWGTLLTWTVLLLSSLHGIALAAMNLRY